MKKAHATKPIRTTLTQTSKYHFGRKVSIYHSYALLQVTSNAVQVLVPAPVRLTAYVHLMSGNLNQQSHKNSCKMGQFEARAAQPNNLQAKYNRRQPTAKNFTQVKPTSFKIKDSTQPEIQIQIPTHTHQIQQLIHSQTASLPARANNKQQVQKVWNGNSAFDINATSTQLASSTQHLAPSLRHTPNNADRNRIGEMRRSNS